MALVVGKAGDVAPGKLTTVNVEGQQVAVANVDGSYYAFVDRCTHLGCPLSTGFLSGKVVTCECHGSQFDVTTGDVVSGPARVPIDTYALRVAGEDLELSLGEEKAAPPPERRVPAAAPAPVAAAAAAAAAQPPAELALARIPLFAGLDPKALESFEAFTFRRTFKPGDLIVEEGRTGNGAYVVLSGRVEVVRGIDSDKPVVISTLGPGEPFGEMALLGDWPRTASVRAVEETVCLGMDRWIFLAHMSKEPKLALTMLQILARRLAEMDQRLA
jgi:nitrite reductase/ring-hydroxylating ferredoxin subunit